jgi:hypothetical protein
MKTNIPTESCFAQFFLQCKIIHTEVVLKRFLCSITFFFENRSFYEIMWKNVAKPDRTQMTIEHAH